MPQYRYAYDSLGSLVDVIELSPDRSKLDQQYICIGCGEPLTAKTKGQKKEKHFSHKVENASCTRETYLHKLGKQAFFDVYSQCLEAHVPFTIILSHPLHCSTYKTLLGDICSQETTKQVHLLTQYYDQIKLEKRDGQFIPDVIIFNKIDTTKKVYVEIAVTHFLSTEKLSSNNRIIEIPIQTETDVEKIRTHCLTSADAKFLNFDPKIIHITRKDECECAKHDHYCLYIYKSGKSFLQHASLAAIEAEKSKLAGSLIYSDVFLSPLSHYPIDDGHVFVRLLENAFRSGVRVRNCFLCKYVGENWDESSNAAVYCKFLRKPFGSNQAVGCKYFRAHPKVQHALRTKSS